MADYRIVSFEEIDNPKTRDKYRVVVEEDEWEYGFFRKTKATWRYQCRGCGGVWYHEKSGDVVLGPLGRFLASEFRKKEWAGEVSRVRDESDL